MVARQPENRIHAGSEGSHLGRDTLVNGRDTTREIRAKHEGTDEGFLGRLVSGARGDITVSSGM